jgi:hypothetical protein
MSHTLETRIILTHDGRTDSLTGWANYLGISRQTLHARLQKYPNNLDKVLISGTKKLGRPTQSATQSIPKLDGLKEILGSAYDNIGVRFSSMEMSRLQKIKQLRQVSGEL